MKGQRKKHSLQLSGSLPNPQSDDARSPDGKLVFGTCSPAPSILPSVVT